MLAIAPQPVATLLIIIGSVAAGAAQTPVPTPTAPSQAAPVAGDDDAGRTDLMDLYRMWRKQAPKAASDRDDARWAITPLIASKPSVGVKVGAGVDVEFLLGDRATTRFSTLTTSLAVSTRKQISVVENVRLVGGNNRWMVVGQNHYAGSASDNVTLGTSSAADLAPEVRYYSMQFNNTVYARIGASLYVGAELSFVRQMQIEPFPADSPDWETSPFYSYSVEHGFDLDRQTAAGPGLTVLFDNRDNQNDAIRGWYGLASYRVHFDGFLGGDSTWQEVTLDLRTYRSLSADKRHKLAFWGLGDFVTTGTAPYLSLPGSSGDELGRSARGYAEGRFRGEQLLSAEVEYRGLLTRNGLLGLTGFVNLTTAGSAATGERLFDSVAAGGGLGLRLLVHKLSRSNFCVDVGWGRDGSIGLYLGFRDAF
jgi:hypothetical protein